MTESRVDPASWGVACGPVAISIGCPSASVRTAFESLFYWQFDNSSARVHWTISARSRESVTRAQPGAAPGDGEFGATVMRNPDRSILSDVGSHLVIDGARRHITVSNHSARGLFIDLYRAVRQVVLSELLSAGFFCIHGSAVVVGERAIVLTGQKGAGKTTTAAALARKGAALLANDKVLVGAETEGGDLIAVHLPEAPGVTIETLRNLVRNSNGYNSARNMMPAPSEWFSDHPQLPTWEEVISRPLNEKLYFSETQWAAFLGARTRASARLHSVFRLDSDDAPGYLTEADLDDLSAFPDWIGLGRTSRRTGQAIAVENVSRQGAEPSVVADRILYDYERSRRDP